MTDEPESIIPASDNHDDIVPAHLVESVRANVEAARSDATRRAYDGDCNRFSAWCQEQELASMPASAATMAAYVSHLADQGKKVSTIQRAVVAISQAHKLAGHESPTTDGKFREVLKGIRNRIGVARRQARPVLVEDLRRMLVVIPNDLRGTRNRAMLNLGLAGAFRRSELVSVDFGDLEFVTEGVIVTLRRSKTDQVGAGHRKGIPHGEFVETCPVRNLRAWLEMAGITGGPVFRVITIAGVMTERRASPQAVNRAVKSAVKLVGLDPDKYSAHSLRAGLVTEASRRDKRIDRIMDMTGHRSEMIVREYVREGELFRDNAAGGIGL